jgi:hypothetical protein
MAERIEVQFVDDIDGGPADTTLRFGVDGTSYEIDLSSAHAEELRNALRPFIAMARKPAAGRRAARARRYPAPNPILVRDWARRQGIKVSSRGRLPDELVDLFQAASS